VDDPRWGLVTVVLAVVGVALSGGAGGMWIGLLGMIAANLGAFTLARLRRRKRLAAAAPIALAWEGIARTAGGYRRLVGREVDAEEEALPGGDTDGLSSRVFLPLVVPLLLLSATSSPGRGASSPGSACRAASASRTRSATRCGPWR